MRNELVIFNGIKYRRYTESRNWSDRNYFTPHIADKSKGVRRLHEEVWIAHHGAIPPGHHVHHIDGNTANNSHENLACLSPDEHREHHLAGLRERLQRPEHLAHLERIRDKAAEWHRSDEGHEWHREHGRRAAERQPLRTATCEQCGQGYQSKRPRRFCGST